MVREKRKKPADEEQLGLPWQVNSAYEDHAEVALARNTDPETSHEAAASIKVPELEGKVMDKIRRSFDGLTMGECAALLRLSVNTVSPRFAPLYRKGLIVDTGRKRPGASGRNQIVWIDTARGKKSGL